MLVKIPKIRFKLTEKERNLTWNSDNNLNQHQQTWCCQSKQGNNILSTTGHELKLNKKYLGTEPIVLKAFYNPIHLFKISINLSERKTWILGSGFSELGKILTNMLSAIHPLLALGLTLSTPKPNLKLHKEKRNITYKLSYQTSKLNLSLTLHNCTFQYLYRSLVSLAVPKTICSPD